MNRAAMLANDYNHFAAHSGGAVFGSKKLKAIVVYGTMRPSYRDKTKLVDAGLRWRNDLQQHDVKKKKTKYGHGEAWGALNNLNWRSTDIQPAHIQGFDQNDVVLRPCFQCARLCPWDAKLGEGEFKGTVVHFNAGGEWLDTFFNLGIKGNAVLYLAEKINNLGIECSHFSCGAGVAFEAWEKGLLGPDRTNGLKLEWGNVEAVEKLLDMAARREGWLGNLLAEGPKQLAEAIGGDAPKWAVHTKGGTPAMHEWRPLLGQMLRELVASGGMKPQGGGSKNPPPDLRDRENWGPLEMDNPEGWVWSHVFSEQYRQFTGIFGGCWFAQKSHKKDGLNSIVDAFNAITGWNFSMDEALASRPSQHDSAKPLRHPARLDRRLRLARRRPKIFGTDPRRQIQRLYHRQVAARYDLRILPTIRPTRTNRSAIQGDDGGTWAGRIFRVGAA